MNSLWQNLIIILEQEIFLYQKLLDEATAQKNHIANGCIEGINQTAKVENTLILKLRIIAETRWKLVRKIALQYSDTDMNLSKLALLADEPYSSKLKYLYQKLKEIAKNIEIINKSNFIYFSHSLQHVQSSLGLLVNKNTEYTEDGLSMTQCMEAGYVDGRY